MVAHFSHPATTADVVIVGGGPAGTAAAIPLARSGHRVVVVERSPDGPGVPDHGRDRPPAAILPPGARGVLRRLAIDVSEHELARLRITSGEASTSIPWPTVGDTPPAASAVNPAAFRARLIESARNAGAIVLTGHDATAPIVERGFVRGALVTDPDGTGFDLRATFTVVADGANSTFGRELGTFRDTDLPHAWAVAGRFRSPFGDSTEVEFVVGLSDTTGTPVSGHAWMCPLGDQTVAVGTLMLSTSPSYRVIRPTRWFEQIVAEHRTGWQLDGEPLAPPAGGRIPMGNSVRPIAGPTSLVVGEAAGAANPFTGAGVEAALTTGALAGEVVAEALVSGATELQRFRELVDQRFGAYYRAGRLTAKLFRSPTVARRVGRAAAKHHRVTEVVARLGADQLDPRRPGLAEATLRAGRALSLLTPGGDR